MTTPPSEEEDSFPTLAVSWDEQEFGLTVAQCDTICADQTWIYITAGE
jgi:hypothetical protein